MKFNAKQLQQMSNTVRANALGAVLSAKSGHVGIILDASEIITAIYANHLRRGIDRFVLSSGHGSAMLYSVLKLAGYKTGDLNTFRKIGGLPGHPEYGIDGVDATTGPLGQGVGNAVGLALAQKIRGIRARTYCLCSDGDLMEGVSFESLSFAGRYNLNNLIVVWDDNKVSIDGVAQTDIDINARMRAMGFNVMSLRGNDIDALEHALERAEKSSRPVFIQCKNILGRGSSLANKSAAHGFALSETEMLSLIAKNSNEEGLRLWNVVKRRPIGESVRATVAIKRVRVPKVPERISTRELSGIYLDLLMQAGADLIIGSADLSNNTNVKTSKAKEISPDNFNGNFINYGVREHAMAAIMNGLCVDGLRAVGSTFLVFSDYMRPSIRLAAMSHLPAIYVFSHDSIAVGEDGPTHQPVEQLPSLRLIPNLNVYRPCNITEIAHAWNSAIANTDTPSAIILSRQKFRQISTPNDSQLSRGAYVIYPAKSGRVKSTLIATGSEVPLAVEIATQFKNVQVVSMLNINDFRKQDEKYKSSILRGCVIAIEAAAPSPWFEFADAVIGLDKFGMSGDGELVYREYGFDVDKIIKEVKHYL
ncbi:MAG: transketolase [Alphaproteobacteria bacterium]|nr:transketolase [Alphaproteobacteria bacterium]